MGAGILGRCGSASDSGHLRQQLLLKPLLQRVVLPAPEHGALPDYQHSAHSPSNALAESLSSQRPLQVIILLIALINLYICLSLL